MNTFKNKFETAKYLVHLKDFSLRQQVAKFRCSDHNLMIEVGRHKNIALENSTCTKCSTNCTGDVVHLLIDCSVYLKFLYSIKNFTDKLLITIPTNYVTILQRRCHKERNTMSTLRPF